MDNLKIIIIETLHKYADIKPYTMFNFEKIANEIVDRINHNKIEKDEPILIGYLNKEFGYNGFKPIEIGTAVYRFKDVYYFEMSPLNSDIKTKVNFYKETLKPCINFISEKR